MAIPSSLSVGVRTDISTADKITFCGSPIHLKIQNIAKDTTIQSAFVYLWIWNGNQNKTLGSPNFSLKKTKVSASDNYINFQVADLIRSFLESPSNATNTNQPNFAYNESTPPAITGQGVFWQIQAEVTSTGGTVLQNYWTNFATLGYRWNYEQTFTGDNGVNPNGVDGFIRSINKWYNPQIHDYFSQDFNFTKTVATATSANIINFNSVTPVSQWSKCSRDPYLIIFLNKLGLWETFTPFGKTTVNSKVSRDTAVKGFRDPSNIDNSYTHSKNQNTIEVVQSYNINTGLLDETMINTIEQLVYSPKIYLIAFKGDTQDTTTVGITIDDTFVTIDDTNITIDSQTVTGEYLRFYKTHRQIPVIITDEDFTRKTRVNDTNKIEYNIKFEETNSKINDIR